MSHKKLDYEVHNMVESFTNEMWVIGNIRDTYISVKPRHSKHYPGGGFIMWGGILSLYFLSQLHFVFSLLVVSSLTAVYYFFSSYSRTKCGSIIFYYNNKIIFCNGAIGYDRIRIKRIAHKMKIDVVFSILHDITTPKYTHYKRRKY